MRQQGLKNSKDRWNYAPRQPERHQQKRVCTPQDRLSKITLPLAAKTRTALTWSRLDRAADHIPIFCTTEY